MEAQAQQQLEEIIRCKNDFVYFCRKYIYILHPIRGLVPFELYEFQEKKVFPAFESHRFVILKKFRQGGLSTTTAIYCLWKALFKTDFNILCISKTDREAVEFMGIIKQAWNELPSWLKCRTTEDNKHVLALETGSKIRCYTPKASRSQAISLLVIDEAAFIQRMDEIWADVFPVINTGGNIIVISTVNGIGNWYHQYWTGAVNGTNDFFPVLLKHTEHPDYQDPKWVESTKRQLGPHRYAQEVLGEFLGSGSSWVPGGVLKQQRQYITPPKRKALRNNALWAITHYFAKLYALGV